LRIDAEDHKDMTALEYWMGGQNSESNFKTNIFINTKAHFSKEEQEAFKEMLEERAKAEEDSSKEE